MIDSSVSVVKQPSSDLPAINQNQNRTSPDFIQGELIHGTNNFSIRAAIGEGPETISAQGGFVIKGVFYE